MPTADAPQTTASYEALITIAREAQLLGGTMGVLGWDQQVMMPDGGLAYRADQLAQLARMHHEMVTTPEIGDLLSACEDDADLMADPTSVAAVNVRELRRGYDRSMKLPASLVEEETQLGAHARHAWAEARKVSDFSMFQESLEKVVNLLRRKADCYGWAEGGEAWDALAEDYEPGCTAADVEVVFTPLREKLQTLLDAIMGSPNQPSNRFNEIEVPIDQQERFVRMVSERYGFVYTRGRLDTSTHPFCGGSHCNDVRMTTRFHRDNFNDAMGSTMHETGHGLYEQGLLTENIGTPMGDAVSLGIHESQSRMWENQVGRSEAFWSCCGPLVRDHLGGEFSDMSDHEMYAAANIVRPDFIRVEADEATYNMHIMIRFEMERALMSGDLSVADVPEAWNQKYKDYLGIDVPDNARGCLQDIHWSMTSMGYFPTYTLGNLYSAQFYEAACEANPGMVEAYASGDFSALLTWLRENIHVHGRRYSAADLVEHVTGKPLSAEPLLRHLETKLRSIYGI